MVEIIRNLTPTCERYIAHHNRILFRCLGNSLRSIAYFPSKFPCIPPSCSPLRVSKHLILIINPPGAKNVVSTL